jgi:hypothetical protein
LRLVRQRIGSLTRGVRAPRTSALEAGLRTPAWVGYPTRFLRHGRPGLDALPRISTVRYVHRIYYRSVDNVPLGRGAPSGASPTASLNTVLHGRSCELKQFNLAGLRRLLVGHRDSQQTVLTLGGDRFEVGDLCE